MSKQLFIKTTKQREWLERIATLEHSFKERADEIDKKGCFPIENFQELRQLGYTKTTLPAKYGGDNFNVYDMILLQETLASYDGSTALSIGWSLATIGQLYEQNCWEQQKLEFFAQEIANGAITNRAASEVLTGSPARGGKPGTTATKVDNHWIINGHKIFTTASPVLNYFLVSCWVEEHNQIGFFLIPRDTYGLTLEETWDVVGMRGTGSHDLILNNVTLPLDTLVELATDRNQFPLNSWMLHIPATYLGIAQAARDYAVAFSLTHAPNSITGTISELPNVQALIGEIDLELAKARFTLYGTAEAAIDPERSPFITNELSIAKHVVTNCAINIVDKAMRIVGAKSLQMSNPLQRYYRDVRAGLHNPPMDEITIQKLTQTALAQFKVQNESHKSC